MSRLTVVELSKELAEYKAGRVGRNLRFGQYILNTYFPKMVNPSLFYEGDMEKAYTHMLFDSAICSDTDHF